MLGCCKQKELFATTLQFLKGFIMRDYARKENSLRNWQDVFAEWKLWMEAEMQKAFSTKPKER
jgi:hypothetical protein